MNIGFISSVLPKRNQEVLSLSASKGVNFSSAPSPAACSLLYSVLSFTCQVQKSGDETQKFFRLTGLMRRRGHTTRTVVKPINPLRPLSIHPLPLQPPLHPPPSGMIPRPVAGSPHLPAGASRRNCRPSNVITVICLLLYPPVCVFVAARRQTAAA